MQNLFTVRPKREIIILHKHAIGFLMTKPTGLFIYHHLYKFSAFSPVLPQKIYVKLNIFSNTSLEVISRMYIFGYFVVTLNLQFYKI